MVINIISIFIISEKKRKRKKKGKIKAKAGAYSIKHFFIRVSFIRIP